MMVGRMKITGRTLFCTLLALCAITAGVQAQEAGLRGCTVMIAGKATTVDGSILFVKTEDDSPRDIDRLWFVPRRAHPPGAVVRLHNGGTIPQVEETYAYFWDECPGTSFSNGVVNEWGVAFGSNGCWSKEDSFEEVAAREDIVDGGLGFRLRLILAERCRTAREAVELAASLIDRLGYAASGRNLNIVGPREAWQLQMVRGKQYVARRVRENEVAIIANTFSIREVDPADRENFVCSPRLIEYAAERGWYDPASGEPFDFARAYAPERAHTAPSNTDRQWEMARLLDRDFPLSRERAREGQMPVSVVPDRRLSVQDAFEVFRSHHEGTDLDRSGRTASEAYRQSPHRNPATICNLGTHRTTVVQQRAGMPADVGTLVWRALDQPCSSVFVPWYLGARRIPEAYQEPGEDLATSRRDLLSFHFELPPETWELDRGSASGIFAYLGGLVDAWYGETIGFVRARWDDFEQVQFDLQPAVEETALRLWERDPAIAREYLSTYTYSRAVEALAVARDLTGAIEQRVWTTGVREELVPPRER
ncbi:MAG: C69 family dipeptidase [bacterium]